MNLKRKLLDLLFIVVLGVVSVAMLLAAQSYSAPAVRRFRETRLKTNVLTAAGIPWTQADFREVFERQVREETGSGEAWFVAETLVIYEFRGRGLWGMIEGIATFDSAVTHIASVRVLSQEETPGLGDRIKEPGYLATYRGKTATEPLDLALRHKASLPNEVDAISGATLSSQALVTIVSAAALRLRTAKGEAQ
ncbi:FMN-binding protein [candidate division WOR-3 bacterium]|uniref:FMN-binding protein n=1 Tax=candidate division WOR-3 bacterium TaxID=2052148 RepID=A0A937XDR8_UNCW3|nr:FMN-binding protein [candidate division WOR-3 bacterium]